MEIKNSESLDNLIAYGKSLGDQPASSMTVDRWVVAAIDAVTDRKVALSQEEMDELGLGLEKLFPGKQGDYSEIRERFMEHIRKSSSGMDMGAIHFQQGLFSARKEAEGNEANVLEPSLLMAYFVQHPVGFLKEVTEGKPKESQHTLSEQELLSAWMKVSSSAKKAEKEKEPEKEPEEEAEPIDPKTYLSELTEDIKKKYGELVDTVMGQEHAINTFISGLFRSELIAKTQKNRHRPKATFLFAGPPGVGKTYLAETVAKLILLPFRRFDMSEYCDKEASLEFIGSDAVYKNGQRGNFTKFIAEHPKSVILLDEVEKAHINIIHLFLQILDAGQVRDSYTDETLSLKDTILIFTTNAGKQLYNSSESTNLSTLSKKVILKSLEKDVNPQTGQPFFPAAICSRFASGNVVMFNHLSAEVLRRIAKDQIAGNVREFEKEFGIRIDIDEDVYTALLLSEGGNVDGRTIRARAESFFHDELYELFRLITSEKTAADLNKVGRVRISVELPDNRPDIAELFESGDSDTALLFTSGEYADRCRSGFSSGTFLDAQDTETAARLLKENDVRCILIDLNYGRETTHHYLNLEDEASQSRSFLHYIREYHSDIPVYILETPAYSVKDEEKISFLRSGAEGFVTLDEDGTEFVSQMEQISQVLHQRNSINKLSRSNKVIRFETAQTVEPDDETAVIKLFDLTLATAVDAEDSENILSSVSKPDITFDKVIGAEDAKSELKYFVEYLKNPKKYMGTGISAPKGVLLYGPPGTGKTMLAKATASASDVTFISAEGNQFMKSYVGEGAEKVHEIFRTARKYAPAIIFIDEIDTIARARTGDRNTVESEAALTAMLAEMDGFKSNCAKPVFVLAATNYDVDGAGEKRLDPAILRRFDRRIYVDLPNREERTKYLKMRISNSRIMEIGEEKIENIAIRSTGMSLAELASVIELAMRSAIKDGNLKVTEKIFDEAFEEFNSGERKHWNDDLLKRVARHEAGHAFLCWYGGENPSYLTIVARSNHGGYMQHDDNEGKALYTRKEMIDRIRTSLGGRASEIVYYGEEDGVSTGASGDLVSATNYARSMICEYGMSERFGLAAIGSHAAFSSNLTADIYEEINRILSEELKNAIDIIAANKATIDALVDELMAKNHLSGDEIREICEKNKNA